ncbi:MAG TPA: hypothetical protein VHK91_15730 [Flavisolibacter sp.]|nr:hypothetical protein [Flavisolibacter sp.]
MRSPAGAQVRFSFATDISILRNFSTQQKFWALGQTVQGNFHFSRSESVYAWLSYHTNGSFTNTFTAAAKSPSTAPANLSYDVKGQWRFRQVSVGWKHYFMGRFNGTDRFNFYGLGGFGLLFATAENSIVSEIDTASYNLSEMPVIGTYDFKRLTIDLGLGAEYPMGANIYLYGDLRTWLPASSYPSSVFHNPNKVPLPVMAQIGLRILIGQDEEE